MAGAPLSVKQDRGLDHRSTPAPDARAHRDLNDSMFVKAPGESGPPGEGPDEAGRRTPTAAPL